MNFYECQLSRSKLEMASNNLLLLPTPGNLQRGHSMQLLASSSLGDDDELGGQLRRAGSLRLPRSADTTNSDHRNNQQDDPQQQQQQREEQSQSQHQHHSASTIIRVGNGRKSDVGSGTKSDGECRNLLHVPDDNTRSQQQQPQQDSAASSASASISSGASLGSSFFGRPARPTRHSAPATAAPAPEYLARSLLQLGCPVVSMPKPRGGVGSEHSQQQSSDSDDSTTSHHGQQHQLQQIQQLQQLQQQQHQHVQHGPHGQGHGQPQGQQGSMDSYGLPKVQVSGPSSSPESSHNGLCDEEWRSSVLVGQQRKFSSSNSPHHHHHHHHQKQQGRISNASA